MQRNPKWRTTTLEYWTRKRKTGNSFWEKEATSCDRKLKVTRTTRETTCLKYISIDIYIYISSKDKENNKNLREGNWPISNRWNTGPVCLPGRRLWRKAGSREVPPIREDFDPCRSSKCARFYTKSARLRYRRRSRSSSRSNQTGNTFSPPQPRAINLQRIYIYIFFPNLYSDVVPVKLNLPPETPGVKPGHAFDPRLQPLPRLGRDPEPLIDVHIGIQWQSASMEVEGVEDLVADHRSEGRVRGIRRPTVPGPGPGRHHRQWDAWNRRATFSLLEQRKNASKVSRFLPTNRVRRRFVVGVHAVGMTTPAKVKENLISNMNMRIITASQAKYS